MKKQRKLVMQQRFTHQEPEQQRNSAVKGASPLLFSQPPEDKGFFCENNSSLLSQLVVTSSLL